MDYVRSCYSTSMKMSRGGASFVVDWYFSDPDHRFPTPNSFGSLNWSKPDYGSGDVGEEIGAARPYRIGYIPDGIDYHNDLHFPPEWFRDGAPADLTTPYPVNWEGVKVLPLSVWGPPGTFPPIIPPLLPNPTLSSSVRGAASFAVPPDPGNRYEWSWPTLGWNIVWGVTDDPKWRCFPGTATMWSRTGPFFGYWLRCDFLDQVAGVSTWTDPAGVALAPGEVLTLVGPAGPPFPQF